MGEIWRIDSLFCGKVSELRKRWQGPEIIKSPPLLVPGAGIEPARPCEHEILSLRMK